MSRIVIIEDDSDIREELELLLINEGHKVNTLTEFEDVAGQIKTYAPDLILLDLCLPGRDGFALCKDIRKELQVPIIFVTGSDSSLDELKALSLGGDDYVTKPYHIPVLLARIQAVLRRSMERSGQRELIEINGLCLDLSRGVIEYNNKSCDVTKNEIKILHRLMRQAGEIVTRADMIEYLWDNQIYIDDNTLSVNMARLRVKIEELGLSHYIMTKRGMGYKIERK